MKCTCFVVAALLCLLYGVYEDDSVPLMAWRVPCLVQNVGILRIAAWWPCHRHVKVLCARNMGDDSSFSFDIGVELFDPSSLRTVLTVVTRSNWFITLYSSKLYIKYFSQS